MTTDITELAQREKFDAWFEREYSHLESSKFTDIVPHIKYGFWMAYQAGGAGLVEALKAKGAKCTRLNQMLTDTECRLRYTEEAMIAATEQASELQSRAEAAEFRTVTVKLPTRSVGEIMHMSGFSRDYAEGWCAGNDNAIREMRAAGIQIQGGE